jgi:hypothetical protein
MAMLLVLAFLVGGAIRLTNTPPLRHPHQRPQAPPPKKQKLQHHARDNVIADETAKYLAPILRE